MISDYRRNLHMACWTKKNKHNSVNTEGLLRANGKKKWKHTISKMIEMNGVKNQGSHVLKGICGPMLIDTRAHLKSVQMEQILI